MREQTTLKRKTTLKGIGLHAGTKVTCVLHPAPAGHGIVFLRSDLSSQQKIRADVTKVIRTDMCTTLGQNGVIVSTVEHLLAALRGMGVDNVLIELDAPEVPILDGSSKEFVDAIEDVGVRKLGSPKQILRLTKKVSLKVGDKQVIAEPSEDLIIKGSIDFGHRLIGEQTYRFTGATDFKKEIASARTFGFLYEVEHMRKKGLALGGSLENAVVLDETNVLNPEGLRFKNEFIRHKVLDAIGDFALLGYELQASVQLHKSGHELHTQFVKKILSDPGSFELVSLGQASSEEESELELLDDSILIASAF